MKKMLTAALMILLILPAFMACARKRVQLPLAPVISTNTSTATSMPTMTSTHTRTNTAVFTSTRTFTQTFTNTVPAATNTYTYTATVQVTASLTATTTSTNTRTNTAVSTFTSTSTSTYTRTNTAVSTNTPTYTATSAAGSSLIYNGDTAGYTVADATINGPITEVAGGNPGNLMRLTYVNPAYWLQAEWNKTVNVNIGANDMLVFEVRMAPGSPNAVTAFKVRTDWSTGGDVFVDNYLTGGGTSITAAWQTVQIPLSTLMLSGQTQVDFITFISNANVNYTVDIDNIRLIASVPANTPTFTNTATITNTVNPAWTSTSTPTITPTSSWLHPGAWSSAAELNYVKTNITAAPYAANLTRVKSAADQAPTTRNFSGVDFNACADEGSGQTDSAICYASALYWYLTGTQSYYTKAMGILARYKTMSGFVSTACWDQQKYLDASWFGGLFANACELLRTSANWTAQDTADYTAMFRNAFYPNLNVMSTGNGNVDLTQIDTWMSMAVFCEDQTSMDACVSRLAARMPAYFYYSTWPASPGLSPGVDGPAHIGGDTQNNGCAPQFPNGFWFCPTSWMAGLMQETCRDNGHHGQFALDAAIQCAEIDYHQGSKYSLYATYQNALVPAMELMAKMLYTNNMQGACGGTVTTDKYDTFEIGYNAYVNRMGVSTASGGPLYYTGLYIPVLRNTATQWAQFNISWETLTHAGVN